MIREEAINLLNQYVKNEKIIYHSLSTEAVMKALAKKLNHDEQQWALAGLLHDIDIEITGADLNTHGLEAVKILKEHGIEEAVVEAVKLHNEHAHNEKRNHVFHHALAAGETITGLIYATALVYPDKKIRSVKPKSVVKRMKQKAFAASVNRDIIMECEIIGLPLQEFTEICLNAMKEIADEIGL